MCSLFKVEKSRSYSLNDDELKEFCDDIKLNNKDKFTITYRKPYYFFNKKKKTDDQDADNINTFRNSHAIELKKIYKDPFSFVNTYIIFIEDFEDAYIILKSLLNN